MKKRVLSGIQPTGDIHLGNYLGAVRQWVARQDDYENIFCIVDLHAITVPQEPQTLHRKTRELAGLLLAAGIDTQKSVLFVQSHLGEHAELAWILNCFTPMGWMQRMTQFKEKSEKQKEGASVGLFAYPALMAADILLYDTDYVPVGEDQKQHIELARDVAQRMNALCGEVFKLPEPMIPETGARIMALDDPTKKMSKSEDRPGQAINLLDPPDAIRSKFMRATTDSLREIRFDPQRPGINNLLVIYELLTGRERGEIEDHFAGKGYADLKRELAEVVIQNLAPLQERYRELTGDPRTLEQILTSGAERVRPQARRVLARVKDAVGLG
jgi:tryptophanyl-tRNA synthetase